MTINRSSHGSHRGWDVTAITISTAVTNGRRSNSRRSWSSRGGQFGRASIRQQPVMMPIAKPSTPPIRARAGFGVRHGKPKLKTKAPATSVASPIASKMRIGSGMADRKKTEFRDVAGFPSACPALRQLFFLVPSKLISKWTASATAPTYLSMPNSDRLMESSPEKPVR